MYKLRNGYTKESMKWHIREFNTGVVCCWGSSCRYKFRDNHCAIGCFIPHNHPGLKLNDCGVPGLLNCYKDLRKYMPIDCAGLQYFQRAHDDWVGSGDIRDHLCEWIDVNIQGDE